MEVAREVGSRSLGDPWSAHLSLFIAKPQWHPPSDLYETATEWRVKVEVAGMSEEDFEITLYDDLLVIEGVRSWKRPAEETRFHAVEIRYGPFRLELPISKVVDRERVRARYEQGLLFVTLPKVEVSG
jgi:HSP20 family protein